MNLSMLYYGSQDIIHNPWVEELQFSEQFQIERSESQRKENKQSEFM
jgi:hypothetical protein